MAFGAFRNKVRMPFCGAFRPKRVLPKGRGALKDPKSCQTDSVIFLVSMDSMMFYSGFHPYRIPIVPLGMDAVSRGRQTTAGSMQKSFSWDRRPDNQSRISGSRKGKSLKQSV